jgi:hypothetical protein
MGILTSRKRRGTEVLTRPRRTIGPHFPHAKMVADLGKQNSRSQRAAYYLDWAAKNLPKQDQPFNVILQQISAYSRLPRQDNPEVLSLRKGFGAVKLLLEKKYKRALMPSKGDGSVRASTDDDETTLGVMPQRLKAIESATRRAKETASIIDVGRLKSADAKKYMSKNIREVLKIVGEENFAKRLLGPKDDGEEK